ncbi:hypothetical protein KAU08_01055 [bacterium]|nr:hypothetical protein [bacterium]
MHDFPILITVDVCDGAYDTTERKPRFDDLMDCLLELHNQLKNFITEFTGEKITPVTWFVRADMQVNETTGSVTGLIEGWPEFWNDVNASGGILGWHPHLYEKESKKWRPIRDPMKLKSEALKIWAEISQSGWRPKVCRMGESVGSSELMIFLDSIGIIADCSALPGRKRVDIDRAFDWEITPHEPYHPDRNDYRNPGPDPLSILEIPFTMANIRAPYDSIDKPDSEILRYIDLSYDPVRLKKSLANLIKSTGYLLAVIHPMQATGLEVPDGNLVLGGLDVVRENLGNIIDAAETSGVKVVLSNVEYFIER